MKIEAECNNAGCPTYGTLQLVSVDKVNALKFQAFDEDGEPVACSFCASELQMVRLSRDEVQFPIGKLVISDEVREKMHGAESDDPLDWVADLRIYLARHMNADHGSVTEDTLAHNRVGAGSMYSRYLHGEEPLWIITSPDRQETRIQFYPPEGL